MIQNNQIILSLTTEEDNDEETAEWVGFVQTMKIFLKKSFTTQNDQLAEQVEALKREMRDGQRQMQEALQTIIKQTADPSAVKNTDENEAGSSLV